MTQPETSSLLFKVMAACLVLVIGIAFMAYFISTKKETSKKEHKAPSAILVQTQQVSPQDHVIQISAMGQVSPALETDLKTQVSGQILQTSREFVPGGSFKKGEVILQIDRADYELDVMRKKALVRQDSASLALEMGNQSIAKDELALLRKSTNMAIGNTDLALRKPQLDQAKANLEKAKADLETAQLQLARTTIIAPFNALVTQRSANIGDIVSTQDTLAKLVSTDEYWIELSIPVHDMVYLNLPTTDGQDGSQATIILDGNRGKREGQLIRMTGSLDSQSRLVSMLVSVPDPLLQENVLTPYKLGLKDTQGTFIYTQKSDKPPMVLGDYVQVVLDGKVIKNTVRLPLSTVRDGRKIWIAKDGKLEMRSVPIAYQDRDYAYITGGISAEDQIITSDISAPIEGMPVRLEGEVRARSAPEEKNTP